MFNIKKVDRVSKKSIVTVDPYSLKSYLYKQNSFYEANKKLLSKENFVVSYLQLKDVIVGSVEIPRSVQEEDLKDAIDIKAYDDLGLDSNIEYEIFFFDSKQDGDDRLFNVFAIDKNRVVESFADVKNISYIDYITVAPFLYKALYKKGIYEAGGIDCFVYFHKDDATVTIYQDGEYLFSKSIRYTLKNISDSFSKELGKRVDEDEFFKMLNSSGLQNSDSSYKQTLMKLFGEVFVYINDVISYAKRAYGFGKVNQLYIGSEIGYIPGIEEFCFSYVNIPSKPLDIKIHKNSDHIEVNPIYSLMALSASIYMEEGDDVNISIFKRPPPFIKRPSGKLTMAMAAGLVLGVVYPAYQYLENEFKWKRELSELNIEYQKVSLEAKKRRAEFDKLAKEHKKIDEKLAAKNKDLDFRTKLLHEIYSKKVSYPMKAKVLTNLFEEIHSHQSRVVGVDNNASDMVVTVRSDSDKDITELLSKLAMKKRYDVSTPLIKRDGNETIYYESKVKVGLHVN
jgi:hypothetical protein